MPKSRKPLRSNTARVAEATLKLLEKNEWQEITLASVARSATLSLSDVLSEVASKSALPGTILRMLVTEVARRHTADATPAGPREHLFDATMLFFDVQNSHAAALKKLYRALQFDPPTLLAARDDILRVAAELLALAEADIGLSPRVQSTIFSGVLVRAVSVWRDDDEEMGKTMAQLDGDLRRIEWLLWPKPRKSHGATPLKSKGGRSAGGSKKRSQSR